ncbi:exosome complex exonuclease RRP41-like protein [Achlya hypogyna]|uniref:Exosome complex exonuclease RRP41-like protein n=1 Tax=Achlya hypogyna TaxID=1202772 RepID=A0A1V9YLE8_ACHHY|nr:exosome complex exonuclease RRP41-like protein [Achlya hypogyna]
MDVVAVESENLTVVSKATPKSVKRMPLGTLSVNALGLRAEAGAKRRRVEVASPKVVEPETDVARLAEVNEAWLDMCCALLTMKRAAKNAPTQELPPLETLVPPKVPTSKPTSPMPEFESRDTDIELAAELLHKESKPSSTCCGCKTGCLKLYCRCFLTKGFCTAQCTCMSCMNTKSSSERLVAITAHLKNNLHAFRSTPAVLPTGRGRGDEVRAHAPFIPLVPTNTSHTITCRCKKSKCSKKYCDCYQAGVPCGPKCQCRDCGNNHTHEDTNTKQILYSHETVKVIVTREPRQNTHKSVVVRL